MDMELSKDERDYLAPIYNYFIESSDFNGIPIEELFSRWGTDWRIGVDRLVQLVSRGLCIIQSSTLPYIIRESIPTIDSTVKYLLMIRGGKSVDFATYHECVYPSNAFLSEVRNVSNLPPYARYLALGNPQLQPLFFDFNVLNSYLEDPKYKLEFHDYYGSLSYELLEDTKVDNAGYYHLKTFGLGYNQDGIRVIVAFPRYLKNLSTSQQNIWEANEIMKPCKVIKPYWDNIMTGCWSFPQSLASGVLHEREYVNKLWKAIFDANLFLKDYELRDLPPDFSFLFIPTSKSLGRFTHLLDKLFSDKLNTKHLRDLLYHGGSNLPPVEKIFDETIGSLNALELWLDNIYTLQNGGHIGKEIIAPFKRIRKLRQPEAHEIASDNKFDIAIYERQNKIFREIYEALVKLRIVLSTHPKAACVLPPQNWRDEVYSI